MFTTIRNAWKIDDLRRKIIFTLMILLVYRVGCAIPVPFLNTDAIQRYIARQTEMGGFLGYQNMISGGGLQSAGLFALGISPYITSSIVVQLLSVAIPSLERLSKEGPEGQKKLTRITRFVTLGLAVLQGIAYYLLNRRGDAASIVYTEGISGMFAAVVIVACFAAGSMLVVWLGEQIDAQGIGNGISLILFVGIVSRAPSAITSDTGLLALFLKGGVNYALVPIILVIFLLMIVAIVIMTNAERRIPVQYAKRVVGRKMYGGQSSFIPVKVTMSGVMPVIFAGAILSLPSMIEMFVQSTDGFLNKFLALFHYDHPVYAVIYLLLIIAFNYFYVAIQYNPMEMANDLRKQSGAIPGIRPGQPTADFISRVISRITLVGALFIAALAIMPILAGMFAKLPIALGGTSIIIVVNVALDVVKSLESQMMMRHYKGFLE